MLNVTDEAVIARTSSIVSLMKEETKQPSSVSEDAREVLDCTTNGVGFITIDLRFVVVAVNAEKQKQADYLHVQVHNF